MFRLADPAVYNKMPIKGLLWLVLFCGSMCAVLLVAKKGAPTPPPHIVFIIADDMGWGDVGFHGSPDIPTPNIDALARAGVVLHNHYAEWACSPSRGALMTGLHSLRLGLQHSVIKAGERTALPLSHTLLPQHLRTLGYSTHLVGKWHLGYHLRAHMPTRRGFDSFFGYLNGVVDYYDYTNLNDGLLDPMDQIFFGVDLYNGTTPLKDTRGRYMTHLITEKARERILNHDTAKPLFLMVSHLAPHNGANAQRLQAPPNTVRRFRHIRDKRRRVYAGMVSELDASVGAVFQALDARGMLGNALVVFLSDNGGVTQTEIDGMSSNSPLRGHKLSLWEGGVRVPALVFSPSLLPPNQGRVWEGLMHVSDWLPTLYSAAGGDPRSLGRIDGRDAWGALSSSSSAPRKDLLLNVDPVLGQAAYRKGDLKVVSGGSIPPLLPPYPSGAPPDAPSNSEIKFPDDFSRYSLTSGNPAQGAPHPPSSVVRDICERLGVWPPGGEEEWIAANRVRCGPEGGGASCDPSLKPCLFNVTEDPCEQNDLADRYPEEVSAMMARIGEWAAQAAAPQAKRRDPLADPACHGFAFVPWMEREHLLGCDYLDD